MTEDYPRLCPAHCTSFLTNGQTIDIAAPFQTVIDFKEMAASLAGIRRFKGLGIPVAQHLVVGAGAILAEGGSEFEAALYLLHDGHEWALGDITRPSEMLLAGIIGPSAMAAIERAKIYWDGAIYTAAGLPTPGTWQKAWATRVLAMDGRMARAEAIDNFGPLTKPHFANWARPKMKGLLAPWSKDRAEVEFLETLDRLIPARKAA